MDYFPHLTFTSISVYEVLFGFNVKSADRQINTFLELAVNYEEVVSESQDYHLAAEIRAEMHTLGTPIGNIDPIIAACAIRGNLPLVTGNTRHPGFIQAAGFSLELLNWRDTESNQEQKL